MLEITQDQKEALKTFIIKAFHVGGFKDLEMVIRHAIADKKFYPEAPTEIYSLEAYYELPSFESLLDHLPIRAEQAFFTLIYQDYALHIFFRYSYTKNKQFFDVSYVSNLTKPLDLKLLAYWRRSAIESLQSLTEELITDIPYYFEAL